MHLLDSLRRHAPGARRSDPLNADTSISMLPSLLAATAKIADPVIVGPFLRFGTMYAAEGVWTGTVMLLVKKSTLAAGSVPRLLLAESHVIMRKGAESDAASMTRSRLTSTPQLLHGTQLESDMFGYEVWKYNLKVRQSPLYEKSVEYAVHCAPAAVTDQPADSPSTAAVPTDEWDALDRIFTQLPAANKYEFFVPRFHAPLHWFFYSCDGHSDNIHRTTNTRDSMSGRRDSMASASTAANPQLAGMWPDVQRYFDASAPDRFCHLMMGIGDQIYNDDVFEKVDGVKKWLSRVRRYGFGGGGSGGVTGDKAAAMSAKHADMANAEVSADLASDILRFYFDNYCTHFQSPANKRVMATIPQVMMWDDHDIFDGFGSYPARIQHCPTVRAIFDAAKRCYLLFQHHTTYSRLLTGQDNPEMFSTLGAHSFLKVLDPTVAVLGLDLRSERTSDQCVSLEMWNKAIHRLNTALPRTIQHLIIIQTMPVIWPTVYLAEAVLKAVGVVNRRLYLQRLLANNPLYNSLMYPFNDDPDTLDDLIDQWGCHRHAEERRWMVNWLQKYAENNKIRVSFISGDSHSAGVGRFSSKDTTPFEDALSAANSHASLHHELLDHRLMYNVTSSAILNSPPPKFLIQLLHLSAWLYYDHQRTADSRTIEQPFAVPAKHSAMDYTNMPDLLDLMDADTMTAVSKQLLADGQESRFLRETVLPRMAGFLSAGPHTSEQFLDVFGTDVDGVSTRGFLGQKIMDRRNWCRVQNTINEVITVDDVDLVEGLRLSHLQFVIHVESDSPTAPSVEYCIEVPPLLDTAEIKLEAVHDESKAKVNGENGVTSSKDSDDDTLAVSPPSCLTRTRRMLTALCVSIPRFPMRFNASPAQARRGTDILV